MTRAFPSMKRGQEEDNMKTKKKNPNRDYAIYRIYSKSTGVESFVRGWPRQSTLLDLGEKINLDKWVDLRDGLIRYNEFTKEFVIEPIRLKYNDKKKSREKY